MIVKRKKNPQQGLLLLINCLENNEREEGRCLCLAKRLQNKSAVINAADLKTDLAWDHVGDRPAHVQGVPQGCPHCRRYIRSTAAPPALTRLRWLCLSSEGLAGECSWLAMGTPPGTPAEPHQGDVHCQTVSSASGGRNLSRDSWARFHKPAWHYHFLFPFYFSMARVSRDSPVGVSPVPGGRLWLAGGVRWAKGAAPEPSPADSSPQPSPVWQRRGWLLLCPV